MNDALPPLLAILAAGRRPTIDERFRTFHADNPHVYSTLVTLGKDWRSRFPEAECSIAMLYEVARWQVSMQTSGDPFKLNNDFRSRYARLIMAQEPEMAKIFETRRMTA